MSCTASLVLSPPAIISDNNNINRPNAETRQEQRSSNIPSTWTTNLDTLHDEVVRSYIENNPKSQVQYQKATKYLPGGNTRSVLHYEPFPMVLASGHDCHVTSLDGREYLDVVSEYSAALFGHSDPDITAAVQSTLHRGFNLGGPGTDEVELAEQIISRFPSIEKVRFTNSGTEANTMAIQIAITFTGRRKILAFTNGYHGGFLSFGAAQNVLNLPYDIVLGSYNEFTSNTHLLTNDLAAIILEPMQGAGGMHPATPAFLSFLRQATISLGAVLIFDEIITSRLHINGLQGYHGIYPDMTTLGKYLGGGFGFGCFGGSADIMALLEPGRTFHSGTFNNNTFSMAVGVAAGRVLTADKIEKANGLGERLREGINRIARQYKQQEQQEQQQQPQQQQQQHSEMMMLTATGFGSAVGVHFHGEWAAKLKDALFFYLLGCGIYVGKRGFLSVNLTHEEEHVDAILAAVEGFMVRIFG